MRRFRLAMVCVASRSPRFVSPSFSARYLTGMERDPINVSARILFKHDLVAVVAVGELNGEVADSFNHDDLRATIALSSAAADLHLYMVVMQRCSKFEARA